MKLSFTRNSKKMRTNEIIIPIDNTVELRGNLNVPPGSNCLVIFSYGSGSSRFSVRNKFVAEVLNKQKIATLLTDLLTEQEDSVYETRFDIELLTKRLIAVTNYVSKLKEVKDLPIGYFGASTGAASALKAAAKLQNLIHAVVSRGGRPDLAGSDLVEVKAPTLLIVGGNDTPVIRLNEIALARLTSDRKLEIVPGATHLFEEPGTLDQAAQLAAGWFKKYLLSGTIKINSKLLKV